jgi:hypothetical protein
MLIQPRVLRPIRRPLPPTDGDRRAVRPPVTADSKLFGGWGVRF